MHYLGVDWAVEKHDLCLLADDGRVLTSSASPTTETASHSSQRC